MPKMPPMDDDAMPAPVLPPPTARPAPHHKTATQPTSKPPAHHSDCNAPMKPVGPAGGRKSGIPKDGDGY